MITTPKEKKKKKINNEKIQQTEKTEPQILENVPDSFRKGNLKVLLENISE